MSPEQMRDAISKVYDGMAFSQKLKKMPDKQVAAMYQRLLSSGKLTNHKPLKGAIK